MQYSCGCINEIDPDSGVLHCVKKCEGHIEELKNQKQDCLEYYESLGCLKNGVPQNKKYIEEFECAYGELSSLGYLMFGEGREMLEIGCGVGMYVPLFLRNEWRYIGVDANRLAINFTLNNFDVDLHCESFEDYSEELIQFDVILAAHVVEHFENAPQMLHKIYGLVDSGGRFYCVLPDDTDPVNPDHLWFFNQETLRALLEKIGFVDIRMTMRKRIERENFIYCVASKP